MISFCVQNSKLFRVSEAIPTETNSNSDKSQTKAAAEAGFIPAVSQHPRMRASCPSPLLQPEEGQRSPFKGCLSLMPITNSPVILPVEKSLKTLPMVICSRVMGWDCGRGAWAEKEWPKLRILYGLPMERCSEVEK